MMLPYLITELSALELLIQLRVAQGNVEEGREQKSVPLLKVNHFIYSY